MEAQANALENQPRTAREVQQDFAESLGYAEEIIWDLLSQEQSEILINKLKQLIRDPDPPTTGSEEDMKKHAKIISDNERARMTFFNAVWGQRKYSNRQSLTAIIYVMVVEDVDDVNRAEDSNTFSCHPVFRARRCISGSSGNSSNSTNCCNIFVDENGRVYQNWEQYVATNELPAGVMVAPERGLYRLVRKEVDKYVTPAGSTSGTVLGYLDKGSAVGGFLTACVPIAGLLSLPVSAPAMAIAGVVGLACAGYATARSSVKLVDRNQHEQSISVTDSDARGHWLGVAGGVVGVGAAGATQVVTAATNAGREVGAVAQLTVNSMNISSIVISGTGVGNGVLDLILKWQNGDDIRAMDVLQLSASLVLFTNSVYNFKLASTIINETANRNIAGYRDTLSSRQRRAFDKASMETARLRGNTRAKLDIIRNVNEVPSRQQFNDLYKINRNMNQEGIRYALASDGNGFVLNGEVQTSAADLRASVQHNQGPNILSQVTQPIPESHAASGNMRLDGQNPASRLIGPLPTPNRRPEPTTYAAGVFALELSSVMVGGVLFVLEKYGHVIFDHVINAESFENLINSMADLLSPEVFDLIMKLTRRFMDTVLDELTSVLKFYISTESVLFRILDQVLTKFRHMGHEELEMHLGEIFTAVKLYFMSLNPNSYLGLLEKCKVCEGYFKITPL